MNTVPKLETGGKGFFIGCDDIDAAGEEEWVGIRDGLVGCIVYDDGTSGRLGEICC